MVHQFAIEIILVFALIYGLIIEDDIVAFEQKIFRRIHKRK